MSSTYATGEREHRHWGIMTYFPLRVMYALLLYLQSATQEDASKIRDSPDEPSAAQVSGGVMSVLLDWFGEVVDWSKKIMVATFCMSLSCKCELISCIYIYLQLLSKSGRFVYNTIPDCFRHQGIILHLWVWSRFECRYVARCSHCGWNQPMHGYLLLMS